MKVSVILSRFQCNMQESFYLSGRAKYQGHMYGLCGGGGFSRPLWNNPTEHQLLRECKFLSLSRFVISGPTVEIKVTG